jgi:hypothetical protein
VVATRGLAAWVPRGRAGANGGVPARGRSAGSCGKRSAARHVQTYRVRPGASTADLQSEDISWLPRLHLLRFLDMTAVNLRTIANWFQVINMLSNLRVLRLSECKLALAHTPIA